VSSAFRAATRAALIAAAIGASATTAATTARAADVEVRIELDAQRMTIRVDGNVRHVWPVSTARRGSVTPSGVFRPQWMARWHRSTLYHGAPMPYSIFFSGNYAIHGTTEIGRLGRRASHGCVRLHPAHARTLFKLVGDAGRSNTRIEIVR
jgi:lipoprotein-anchoring transpeptidase ErfK/SrfK